MVKPLEEIIAAGARFEMHMNFGGSGHGLIYTCNAEPRISLSKGWRKARGKNARRENYRTFSVQGVEERFLTLEEAWMTVNKLDQAKERDAEWAAAAPKKAKPAYIPGMID